MFYSGLPEYIPDYSSQLRSNSMYYVWNYQKHTEKKSRADLQRRKAMTTINRLGHLCSVLKNAVTDPDKRFLYLASYGISNHLDDETYIRRLYKARTGQTLNLEHPETFNEKIQWLKLYDRKPVYTRMADKYAVRKLVTEKSGGGVKLIPVYGVWKHFDDIDFDALPGQFVIKCTHDSGSVKIVRNKQALDMKALKKDLEKALSRNYFYYGREWVYKNIRPAIIAEKLLTEDGKRQIDDYKIFCFGGEPKVIQVDIDRFTNHRRNLYTTDWKLFNAQIEYPYDRNYMRNKPVFLEEMLEQARRLSEGIAQVRVDFYYVGGSIYFGELTFYHGDGFERFLPDSFARKMGDWIQLPEKRFGGKK